MKIVDDHISTALTALSAEALALAEACGLDVGPSIRRGASPVEETAKEARPNPGGRWYVRCSRSVRCTLRPECGLQTLDKR